MDEPIKVMGFHGTKVQYIESMYTEGFALSENSYDWLGDGIYFFQDAPERAWEWAIQQHGSDAAVIGAKIRLESCIDLLDIAWGPILHEAYDFFLTLLKETGQPLPIQTRKAHRLDRHVINYAIGMLNEQNIEICAVRAAFNEGSPIFPDSAIFDRSHVQIAIRDENLIEEFWKIEGNGIR
jgi:hypothetical protein